MADHCEYTESKPQVPWGDDQQIIDNSIIDVNESQIFDNWYNKNKIK